MPNVTPDVLPKYRNYLSLELEYINTAAAFYFVPNGIEYKFIASPQPIVDLQQDVSTTREEYWLLTNEEVYAHLDLLFPNKEISEDNFSAEGISTVFGWDPRVRKAVSFSLPALNELIAQLPVSNNEQISEVVASRLMEFSLNKNHQNLFREINGILPFVNLLKSNDATTQKYAVAILMNLAFQNADNQTAICEANAIPRLVYLLRFNDEELIINVVIVLRNLAFKNLANQDAIRAAEGIPCLVDLLFAYNNKRILRDIATTLGYLAFNNLANQDATRAAEGIPCLVDLLFFCDNEMIEIEAITAEMIQREATIALMQLAANNLANQNAIREEADGIIIPRLVSLLKTSKNEQTKVKVAGALNNLAHDNLLNQDAIRKENGISLLIDLLATSNAKTTKIYVVRALTSLAHNNLQNQDAIREAGGISLIVSLLTSSDEQVQGEGALLLAILAKNNVSNQNVIRKENGISLLGALSTSNHEQTKKYATIALGHLGCENSTAAFFQPAPDETKAQEASSKIFSSTIS